MSDIHEIIRNQIKQPLWDNWYIKEELGRGATGVVYRIEAKRENRTDVSALKVEPIIADEAVYVDEAKRREYLERKRREAENETTIMYKLRSSPNIVLYEDESIKPLIVDNRQVGYYIMIRMECLTCIQKLMRQKTFDFSEKNVLKLAIDIGSGIRAAHEMGVIHRDVKPGNFFVSDNGTYKLGDFNISKKSVSTRSFAGTEGYIAPEIYYARYGSDGYTKQADIYSFGISLYCIMNNFQFPFGDMCLPEEAIERRMNGENLPRPKNASVAFAKVILKACAFNTADRYQNMTNMLRDLMALRDGAPAAGGPVRNPVGYGGYINPPVPPPMQPQVQQPVNYGRYVQPPMMPPNYSGGYHQAEKSNKCSAATKIILAAGLCLLVAILAILVIFLVKERSDERDSKKDTPVVVEPDTTEQPETTEPPKTTVPAETSVTEETTTTEVTTTTTVTTTEQTTTTVTVTTTAPVLPQPSGSDGKGSSNVVNGGYAVSDGNTLYCSDETGCIYAVRNDTKETIFNTRASYMNVVGDNLIFCNWSDGNYICSIRKDGSGFNILNPAYCYELTYYDGWLYFTEMTDSGNPGAGNYICRMRPDGSEYSRLRQVHCWYMNVTDGRIFFVNYGNNYSLEVMNVDGSGHTVMKDSVSDICVSGGRIYYSANRNDRWLYSMNYDGSDNFLIREGYTKCTNVVGNTIYCVDENDHLMVIDLENSSGLVYPNLGYVGYPVVVGSDLYTMDDNSNVRIFSLE
ncbi:MAG: DUF5050 domain-containing protein [Ruminococcus sp.]|nr:DUF5050 domain-containing protein [Ruminococcus sp.]